MFTTITYFGFLFGVLFMTLVLFLGLSKIELI